MSENIQALRKNWILTDKGDLFNLDFISKIIWGNVLLPIPQPTWVIFYHGISQGKGATVRYIYGSSAKAEASYTRVVETLKTLGLVTDLSPTEIMLNGALVPATGPAAGGTSVVINGVNFPTVPQILFDTTYATNVVFISPNQISCDTPPHAAGLVDITINGDTFAGQYTYV